MNRHSHRHDDYLSYLPGQQENVLRHNYVENPKFKNCSLTTLNSGILTTQFLKNHKRSLENTKLKVHGVKKIEFREKNVPLPHKSSDIN